MYDKILVIVAIGLLVLPEPLFATDYVVGDGDGWTNYRYNYTAWAENYDFFVGDTIVFNYRPGFHRVCEVGRGRYKLCSRGFAKCLTSGNDRIELKLPGRRYFFCDVGMHCDNGQKVIIDVKPKP